MAGVSDITHYVHLTESGSDTILSVDATGSPTAAFIQVATLAGVTGLDANQLVLDGNLQVTAS